jgi:glutamine amidotransferase
MIDVIDYRAGNAPSVMYALARLGIDARLTAEPTTIRTAARIILPGVGAAQATMDSLIEADLVDTLARRVLDDGVPFLGICIGLQVLFDHSAEGDVDTLGWIPGTVERFPDTDRVPQIGWNHVRVEQPHPVLAGLPDDAHCYFVNSFYAAPTNAAHVLATTTYSTEFCSVAGRDNIVATQFHAEKSGPLGLRILENFAAWDGTC